MTVKHLKRRYLKIQLVGDPPSKQKLMRDFFDRIRLFFGEVGLAQVDAKLIKFDGAHAVIRTNHKYLHIAEMALTLIGDGIYVADILKISGTLKSLAK